MARQLVGKVSSLARYPVKSMLGERLERLEIGERGVIGDRAWALREGVNGKVVSQGTASGGYNIAMAEISFPFGRNKLKWLTGLPAASTRSSTPSERRIRVALGHRLMPAPISVNAAARS